MAEASEAGGGGERSLWKAFVAEDVEYDEVGPIATGEFSCHLERDDWDRMGPVAPDGLDLPALLVSARQRSCRVVVQIPGEGRFSAGEMSVGEPVFDDSREFERRRPSGWEFLERTESDEPIQWDVLVDVDWRSIGAITDPTDPGGAAWQAALRRSSFCEVIEAVDPTPSPVPPDTGTWTVRASFPLAIVRVWARTHADALHAAVAAADAAVGDHDWPSKPVFSTQGAFPTGSDLADTNAHLGQNGILW